MPTFAAHSIGFRAAVAPRGVSSARKTSAVRAASRANVVSCNAQVEKVAVNDVKDHLDRGFIIVDIRDPDECAATGYKSSWKNIVVRAPRDARQIRSSGISLTRIDHIPARYPPLVGWHGR